MAVDIEAMSTTQLPPGSETAEALKAGQRAGYRLGVLQSSEAGHSFYLALGFRDVGNVYAFMQLRETDSPETNV
jgi:hypothetical protein